MFRDVVIKTRNVRRYWLEIKRAAAIIQVMDTTHFPQRNRAFSFVDLLIILAVIAILAGLLLPALARAKAKAQAINCMNNLKQAGLAFRIWSTDNNDHYPMQVSTNKGGSLEYVAGGNAFRHFQAMSNELMVPKILACPTDDRKPARDFLSLKNENVSYFVGVDADEAFPTMFLSGDRNLMVNSAAVSSGLITVKSSDSLAWNAATMHRGQGNVGLADGSVQQVPVSGLQRLMGYSRTNINRLAIP